MKKLLPVIFCISVCVGSPASAALSLADRYTRCTSLANSDPAAALKLAEEWQAIVDEPAATHCRALSLFKLQRFAEAAGLLELLTIQIPETQLDLWGQVVLQSGYARRKTGEHQKAVENFTVAIERLEALEDEGDTLQQLLVERARSYLYLQQPLYAVQDLDYALARNSTDNNAYLLRAAAFITMKEPAMAQQDIQIVLDRNPNHIRAKELLARVKSGDSTTSVYEENTP